MNTPRILITAATGKTGTPAIKELLQQGIAARVISKFWGMISGQARAN